MCSAPCAGRPSRCVRPGRTASPRTPPPFCATSRSWVGFPPSIALASGRYRQEKDAAFPTLSRGFYLFVCLADGGLGAGPDAGIQVSPESRSALLLLRPSRPVAGRGLESAGPFAWIFMLVKTSQGELIKLPVLANWQTAQWPNRGRAYFLFFTGIRSSVDLRRRLASWPDQILINGPAAA